MNGMMMYELLSLLTTALATARLTRLVSRDVLLEKPRARVLTWLTQRDRTMLAYLVVCPWCLSMYLGFGGAAGWWLWGESKMYLAVTGALAFSYVTGILASKESE